MNKTIKISRGPSSELGALIRFEGQDISTKKAMVQLKEDSTPFGGPYLVTNFFVFGNKQKLIDISDITGEKIIENKYKVDFSKETIEFSKRLSEKLEVVYSKAGSYITDYRYSSKSIDEFEKELNNEFNSVINLSAFYNRITKTLNLHRDYLLDLKMIYDTKKQKPTHNKLGRIEVWGLDNAAICNGKDWFKFDFRACIR